MKKYLAVLLAAFIAQPAWAEIVIGVSAPVTGPAASVCEISLPGLKQAVADINAKGGVKGESLKLEILDDACDPKQAVAVAGKFAGMNVAAVVSVSCSGAVQAAARTYDEEGLPFLVALGTNPDLTKSGHTTMFRPGSRDDADAEAGVRFMMEKFPGKKIAVLHDKSTWGKGAADLVVAKLKAAGAKAPDVYDLNPGEQDFGALISRLKAAQYDVVYPSLYMKEGGLLLRQMHEQGYAPTVVGPITLGMPDALSIAGAAINGAYITRQHLARDAAALGYKLNPAAGEAGVYNVQSYASIQILAASLGRAGADKKALVADMRQNTFDTVLGKIKFNADGDTLDIKYDVLQFSDGTSRVVWRQK